METVAMVLSPSHLSVQVIMIICDGAGYSELNLSTLRVV